MQTLPIRPVPVHPYFRRSARTQNEHIKARAAGSGPWKLTDLLDAYTWPTKLTGGGVIAIIELGGGWIPEDMAKFFANIGQPVPSITDVSVDGTKNTPDNSADSADGEVALDIQLAGGAYQAATGKTAVIRVYWCQDIATGVRAALKDGCDVCSISWGADEAEWGATAAKDMEQAAIEATSGGMCVFAASGDNDSGDGGANAANVDLPAGCPHVIGCGGTNKTRTAETVWNNNPGQSNGEGTGGGYSTLFPVQAFQIGAPPPPNAKLGRMVPDVAACADPNTGYEVELHGETEVFGGTSAVAPLYAGLFASFGKKLGGIATKAYQSPHLFDDIVSGDNGTYTARVGLDPCTGLGAPVGTALAKAFAVDLQQPAPTPTPTPTPVPTPAPTPTPVPLPPSSGVTLHEATEAVTKAMSHLPTTVHRSTAITTAIDALQKLKGWPAS